MADTRVLEPTAPQMEELDDESKAILDDIWLGKPVTDPQDSPAPVSDLEDIPAPAIDSGVSEPSSDVVEIPEEFLSPPGEASAPKVEPKIEAEAETFPTGDENSQKTAWNALAFEKRDLKRKNAELAAELVKTREAAAAADPAEILSLKEQNEALEAKVGQYNLAETETFKKTYNTPIQEKLAIAASLMVRSGLDQAQAGQLTQQVIQMKDLNDRIRILGEEAPNVSGPLVSLFEEIDQIRARRADALRDWKSHTAAHREAQKRSESQQNLAETEKLTKDAVAATLAEGNFLYVMHDDRPEWNAQVDARVAALKGVLARRDMGEIARYVADGLSGRVLREHFIGERSRRKAAETELSSIRGASPRVGGGGGGGATKIPDGDQTDEQIMEAIWR